MKKIATVALLPVIALVSCGKEQPTVEKQEEVSLKDTNIKAEVITEPVENSTTNETTTWEVLNENIVSTSTIQTQVTSSWKVVSDKTLTGEIVQTDSIIQDQSGKKDFKFTYDLYGKSVNVKWVFNLVWGKIKSVSFEWTDYSVWQQPLKNFTETVSKDIIGKELKWLKIDSVSWASLSSAAFNLYVGSL